MKELFRTYYKTIIWLSIMCYLLFTTSDNITKSHFLNFNNSDKLVHLLMFICLSFISLSDIYKSNKNRTIKVLLLIFFVIGFGALSEYIQYAFIPGRTGNIWDLVADVTGCFIGMIIFYAGGYKLVKRIIPFF